MIDRPSSQPPRKVVIATVMKNFTGPMDSRLSMAEQVIDDAAAIARAKYNGKLDLVVLPEHAIQTEHRGQGVTAAQKAVPLEGPVLDRMAAKARQYHTYLVVPLIRREKDGFTNVAALLDREGKLVGVYSKLHPVGKIDSDELENGITPGTEYPVFGCDFGNVGIQICWDMSYNDGFDRLGAGGANLVVVPSASPQTIAPAAHALRNRYWIVTSTPRDNATIFNPAGQVAAQTTKDAVLVQQIDLSYAVLHWQDGLSNGQRLTEVYGDKVGYQYSTREDTGVFWSNDLAKPIGEMVREQDLREMPDHVEADRLIREQVLQD
jgi:predicted amidohydrolase